MTLMNPCLRVLAVAMVLALAPVSAAEPPPLHTIDPARLQTAVADAAAGLLVPGALVLVRTPQGSFTAAVGTTELGTSQPPTPLTHFRIASNTKTMTAALVVLLAQQGALTLDDPVSRYVPGVPGGDDITVAQLLTMRSGLYGYTDAPELAAALDADPSRTYTPAEVLAMAFARPPRFAPGAEFDYSNTNYALLGLVAERVTGTPLAVLFQERLLRPHGLTQTLLPAGDELPAPYSHGYMYGGTSYALVDAEYPPEVQAGARAGTLQPTDYTFQNPSYATAAGGAVSTADDLARWMQELVSGNVFDPQWHRRWLDSLVAEDPGEPEGQKYGYGISYQRFGPQAAMYYHGGELPGFNSFMGHDPDNDVTLVIWTNLTVAPDGRTTANALLPVVLREIYRELDF